MRSLKGGGPTWVRALGAPASAKDDPLLQAWLGTTCITLLMYGYMMYEGQVISLWRVVSVTAPLYVTTFLVTIFGAVWWKSHETFQRQELVLYFFVAFPITYISTAFGFWYLTDLGDIEIRNGYAVEYWWREAYYTERYDSDKKQTVRTSHPAEYRLNTSNEGEYISVSASEWRQAVSHWGGSGRVNSSRIFFADGEGFESDHDGRPEEHSIRWDARPESRIPTAIERRYVNYLRASDSVLKIHGAMSGYEQFLCEYPRTKNLGFGKIDFDRVVLKGASVPPGLPEKVDQLLDTELCALGARRQCNVLVYVVGCDSVGFFSALLHKWQMGKNNDVVVVIGCSGTKIGWCRVMAWTDNKAFVELLERNVRDLGDLAGNEEPLVRTIVGQIDAPGDKGYVRKPMEDYAYLAADIRMPWWAQGLVVVGSCIALMPTILIVIRD